MTPDSSPGTGEPAFGEADLTNCERELIHLPGSIMPHGVLLVVGARSGRIELCSENTAGLLGRAASDVVGAPVSEVLPELDLAGVDELDVGAMPTPVRLPSRRRGAPRLLALVHRLDEERVSVELEDLGRPEFHDHPDLADDLPAVLEALSTASALDELADELTRSFKRLSGYDRVMLYRFDGDGHGEVVGEAREPTLESFLGLRYPRTDIPQRARQLYMRNRVRMLVDVDYEPVPLVPADRSAPLDMSQCVLRSMSPIHLQYLRNMGVTATLVASILYEGRLWGLIACHHYSTKYLAYDVRATADLLAETVATRIAVLESYKRAEAEVKVRQLEAALIEEVQNSGDWKAALFNRPSHFMRPVGADGAALVHGGEILTAGATPARAHLERMVAWVEEHLEDEFFVTSMLRRDAPALADPSITEAAGLVVFRLSRTGEYVMWFRAEQPRSVRWAGDPRKGTLIGNDPKDLSPRRSFAVWNELVRGTAQTWKAEEVVAAQAIGLSLRDIAGQTKAMSFLLTEHRMEEARTDVLFSGIPLVVADSARRVLLASKAFVDLFSGEFRTIERLEDVLDLLEDTGDLGGRFQRHPLEAGWVGRATLRTGPDERVPVAVRVDPIPVPGGKNLGFIMIVNDLTPQVKMAASRLHVNETLGKMAESRPPSVAGLSTYDRLLSSILSYASVAALEIADPGLAPPRSDAALRELEASTERTVRISRLIADFRPTDRPRGPARP